jgi:hypothetical protein
MGRVKSITKYYTTYGTTTNLDGYSRVKLREEYSLDTAPEDEEPNSIEYVIHYDRYWGHQEYEAKLTWQRWVTTICKDQEPEDAMRMLRQDAPQGYRLVRNKYDYDVIVFRDKTDASRVANRIRDVFGKATIV